MFVALQKLGRETAKQIHKVAGVPRSPVYGAAEVLKEQGPVEVQRSTPIVYRPVDLDETSTPRTAIRARPRTGVRSPRGRSGTANPGGGTRGRLDRQRARASIDNRVEQLVHDAEREIVFGVRNAAFVSDAVAVALANRAAGASP